MEILCVPQGSFRLERYPHNKNLRAWDAADEYLLQHFSTQIAPHIPVSASVLLVNDSFAALAMVLNNFHCSLWTDSFLSLKALEQNTKLNQCHNPVKIIYSTDSPDQSYDVVLIKIPKTLALLEDQLARLQPVLTDSTVVVAAGMAKNIHRSTLALFDKYIGITTTSLAKKKARLIFSVVDKTLPQPGSPYPVNYLLEGTDYLLSDHANVFSCGRLDIGTRFMLQHIPQDEDYSKIIDLGCGNGVLGIVVAEKNPQAELLFIDESCMAIESARMNFQRAFAASRKAEFKLNNALEGIAPASVDLILNNPPFHQQHGITNIIARKMFRQAQKVLRPGGELIVIGNRHLGYHIQLKKLFTTCEVVASNKKFVILRAIK